MARKFNLQPWRVQRREEQKKNFIIATAVIAFVCLAAFGADYWLQTKHIEQQQAAIALLNQNIAKFTKAKNEVKRIESLNKEIDQQISVIQELQSQRGLATEMLNYIALNTPENVFLNAIDYQNKRITIQGVAANDSGISQFMRNMERFPYFSTGNVNYSAAKSNQRYIVDADSEAKEFDVSMTVESKIEPESQQ